MPIKFSFVKGLEISQNCNCVSSQIAKRIRGKKTLGSEAYCFESNILEVVLVVD